MRTGSNVALAAGLVAGVFALGACSSASKAPPPPRSEASYVFAEGVPGGVYVRTTEATAKVIFVDKAERKVTLLDSDGKKTTLAAGPEIRNFDQMKVGDQLNVTVAEELVIRMAGPGPAGSRDGAAALVALAPLGSKPAILVADAVQGTATVTAIDHAQHKATLRFPDGSSETFPIRPDVDLAKRRVGEEVTLRSTVAVAMEITPPPAGR